MKTSIRLERKGTNRYGNTQSQLPNGMPLVDLKIIDVKPKLPPGLDEDGEKVMLVKFDHFLDKIAKFHFQCKDLGIHFVLDDHLAALRLAVDAFEEVYQGLCGRVYLCKSLDKGVIDFWQSRGDAYTGFEQFNTWLKDVLGSNAIFKDVTLKACIEEIVAANIKFMFHLKEFN